MPAFVAQRMGLVGKSKRRERLPTLDELDRLMKHFGAVRVRRPSSLPMQRIIAFALAGRRRSSASPGQTSMRPTAACWCAT